MAPRKGAKRSAARSRPKRIPKFAQKGKKRRQRIVYLSYSWDSAIHMDWVSKLAFRLEANGLKVVVDQWNTRLGNSLTHFMETAVSSSDFVLLICTPNYKKRADARKGGVGYEQDLMTAEKLVEGNHNKFIPVLREGEWRNALPVWIASNLGADLRGDRYAEDNFQNLVEHLLHAPTAN